MKQRLRHVGFWFYLLAAGLALMMSFLVFKNYFNIRNTMLLLTFILFLVLLVYLKAKHYEKRAKTICHIFLVNALALWFFFMLKSLLGSLAFVADVFIILSVFAYVYVAISTLYHLFKIYF